MATGSNQDHDGGIKRVATNSGKTLPAGVPTNRRRSSEAWRNTGMLWGFYVVVAGSSFFDVCFSSKCLTFAASGGKFKSSNFLKRQSAGDAI